MTWELMLWLFSVAGAMMFFAAGRLTVRRLSVAAVDPPAPVLRPLAPVPAATVPRPRPPPPVADTRERDALRLEVQRLQRDLAAARDELGRLSEVKAHAEKESDRLRGALAAAERQYLAAHRQTDSLQEQLRARMAAAQRDVDLLVDRTQKLADTEAQLEGSRQEVLRWQERLNAAETRVHAAEARLQSPAVSLIEQTLRQDLAIKTDQLATRSHAVRRLESENAGLRLEISTLAVAATEAEWLRAENASLRAQSFVARPVPRNIAPTLGGGDGLSRGSVLQTLVQRVSRLGDVRCAVVADELGLVVASHGELGDEVAAVGALFERAGQQAQQVLPLQNVERVTVEDRHGIVLAIRPLRTDHPDQPELSLITLAVGSAPDQRLLNKLIAEGPRLALIP